MTASTMGFADVFAGHPDFWGALHGECIKEPPSEKHWRQHLDGKVSLGVYPLRRDGTCRWGCIDIDVNNLKKAVDAYEALAAMGVNCGVFIERSKGKGFHVWLLLNGLAPAHDVRRILSHAADKAGLSGVEIFPKQDKLDEETKHGNYVNLPYNGENVEGRRMMLDPLTGNAMSCDDFLQDIRLFPTSSLDLVLAELPPGRAGDGQQKNAPGWLAELLDSSVPVGQRRVVLPKIAGYLRRHAIDEDVAVNLVVPWTREYFVEEFDGEEVEKHIRGVYGRYGKNGSTGMPDDEVAVAKPVLDAGDGDLPRVSRQAWQALLAANDPPELFRHGALPTWIAHDDDGVPVIQMLTIDRMRHRLARVGDWYRDTQRKGQTKREPAVPPIVVVRDVLAEADPPLPVLNRIVNAPVFGPDGVLNDAPGYHPSSRTFYTGDVEVTEGVTAVIDELLCDFPFVSQAEKAHAIALMILPFVRDLINGPTPLHLIEKPTPGTGGSLLAEVLAFPSLGRPPTVMTEGRDEDEMRKRITARLVAGPSFILIDNVSSRLEAAALSAVLTSSVWEDRRLGATEMIKLPVRCAWVATGNNVAVSNEIARRTVRIRLDAKQDRPWERTRFRHPDIRRWAAEHRGEIVGAILTMVKNWLDAARPRPDASLGGFESWSDVIGGILMVNDVEGFLANVKEFYDVADEETVTWRSFLAAWFEKYGSDAVGVSQLWNIITNEDIDIDLGSGKEQAQRVNLGRQLRKRRDRQFGSLRLTSGGLKKRAQQYQLEEIE